MVTISGASNWQLTVQRSETSVTILRAVTCDRCAALPDELLGLPVTALSDHALAGGTVSGEEISITCGQSDADWDNRKLRELTLPETLTSVGSYAFMNCRELRTLHLHDSVQSWGISVLMNCQSLSRILLTRTSDVQGETLAYLADELSRELDVSIYGPDGSETRLIFPEYIENYEENSPAHHFDYVIYGAGHPYHHFFHRKMLQLSDYDALWERFLSVEHDNSAALRLAWWRLRRPCGLDGDARRQYESYLRAHESEALRFALEERDMDGLRQLLSLPGGLSAEAISAALSLAREQHATEASAILLEKQHRCRAGVQKSFDL